MILKKKINNYKNKFNLNSKYWQDYKKTLPFLPSHLFESAVGMILGDATMYKVSREAYIKFEQGFKQKDFLYSLFEEFKTYSFMEKPGTRLFLRGPMKGEKKSFWFKTFSHQSFTKLYTLFYKPVIFNKKVKYEKRVNKSLIRDFLTPRGLAYWVMCDGSLGKDLKTLTFHTQGFNKLENEILSAELNTKYNLHTKVKLHKKKYYVLETRFCDASSLYNLINPYIISSMKYKLPCIKKIDN